MSTVHSTAELGRQIAERRTASTLTQEDLAGLVGTDRQYISELERGKVTQHLARLVAVLDALGLELAVVPRSEGPPSEPADAGSTAIDA